MSPCAAPAMLPAMNAAPTHVRKVTVFLGTFLASWLLLDQVITSPPTLVSATAALAASATVLAIGQAALGIRWRSVPESLGLRRPVGRAVIVAALVGGLYFTSLILGARVIGVSLDLLLVASLGIPMLVFLGRRGDHQLARPADALLPHLNDEEVTA